MAKPIKETPILKGKDAKAFNNSLKSTSFITQAEKDRRLTNFQKLQQISTF